MNKPEAEIALLKSLWTRGHDGRWGVNDLKGISLKPQPGFDTDFFKPIDEIILLSNTPPRNITDAFAAFGPTTFFLKQSILPVVAWVDGEALLRCIGTAFLISRRCMF